MGEVIAFPSDRPDPSGKNTAATQRRPTETVFQDRGWRILELPSAGQFLAVSDYCRRGVEVGRFDPRADCGNHHDGTEIAILTRCAVDERLARCSIAWLNSGGPRTAILGAFVVAAGGRYRYWRDAIVEVAAIGGTKLVRLIDGSIANRPRARAGAAARSVRTARREPASCCLRSTTARDQGRHSALGRPSGSIWPAAGCSAAALTRGRLRLPQPCSANRAGCAERPLASLPAGDGPPILTTMRRLSLDPTFEGAADTPVRLCDHAGCIAGGAFRAPKSRLDLHDYYWFCLEHVRAYNSAWNYYAGMNDNEIEAEIRHDTVWQRPSWRLGDRHGPSYADRIRDHFGVFSGGHGNGRDRSRRSDDRGRDSVRRALSAREQALAVFEIEPPFTPVRLKARYKALVKLHHPDAHGGDKAAEEKLKIINQAYATLKASYFG